MVASLFLFLCCGKSQTVTLHSSDFCTRTWFPLIRDRSYYNLLLLLYCFCFVFSSYYRGYSLVRPFLSTFLAKPIKLYAALGFLNGTVFLLLLFFRSYSSCSFLLPFLPRYPLLLFLKCKFVSSS